LAHAKRISDGKHDITYSDLIRIAERREYQITDYLQMHHSLPPECGPMLLA
jgi:hypothetical protein